MALSTRPPVVTTGFFIIISRSPPCAKSSANAARDTKDGSIKSIPSARSCVSSSRCTRLLTAAPVFVRTTACGIRLPSASLFLPDQTQRLRSHLCIERGRLHRDNHEIRLRDRTADNLRGNALQIDNHNPPVAVRPANGRHQLRPSYVVKQRHTFRKPSSRPPGQRPVGITVQDRDFSSHTGELSRKKHRAGGFSYTALWACHDDYRHCCPMSLVLITGNISSTGIKSNTGI